MTNSTQRYAPSHAQVSNAATVIGQQHRGEFDRWTKDDWIEFKADWDAFRAKWRARTEQRIAENKAAAVNGATR